MNQKQRDYAVKRLNHICPLMVEGLRKKHTTLAVKLTPQERVKALRKGAFSLRKNLKGVNPFDRCDKFLEFTGEKDGSFDQKAFDKDLAVLETKIADLKDRIMLGDAKTALAALTEMQQLSY